jgi:hypothetical protein
MHGEIYGNLRKPARARRARAMQLFCAVHKYRTAELIAGKVTRQSI